MQNGTAFLSSTWWQLLLFGQLNIRFFCFMHPFWELRSSSGQRQVCGLLHHLCLITAFEPCENAGRHGLKRSKHLALHGAAWTCCVGMRMRALGKHCKSPFVNMAKATFKTLSKGFPTLNFVLDESQNKRITTSLAWWTALRNKLRKTRHPTKNGK